MDASERAPATDPFDNRTEILPKYGLASDRIRQVGLPPEYDTVVKDFRIHYRLENVYGQRLWSFYPRAYVLWLSEYDMGKPIHDITVRDLQKFMQRFLKRGQYRIVMKFENAKLDLDLPIKELVRRGITNDNALTITLYKWPWHELVASLCLLS